MTNFNNIKDRFDAFRKLTMDAIGRELQIDYCGKSYEGTCTLGLYENCGAWEE